MEVTLELDAGAIREVAARQLLRDIRRRGQDWRPIWDNVLDVIFDHETDLFRNQGRTQHEGSWAPLSESYAKWKGQYSPGTGMMLLSRRLFRQMAGLSGDHYERKQRAKLVFGSKLPIKWKGGKDDLGGLHMEGREEGTAEKPMLDWWEYGPPGKRVFGGGTFRSVSWMGEQAVHYGEHTRMSKRILGAMPARPPIRTTDQLAGEIADIALDYLLDARIP